MQRQGDGRDRRPHMCGVGGGRQRLSKVTEEEVQVGGGRRTDPAQFTRQDSRGGCEGCFLPGMLGGRRTFQPHGGVRGFTHENGGCRRALELHFLKEPWMKKAQGKEKSRDVSLASESCPLVTVLLFLSPSQAAGRDGERVCVGRGGSC